MIRNHEKSPGPEAFPQAPGRTGPPAGDEAQPGGWTRSRREGTPRGDAPTAERPARTARVRFPMSAAEEIFAPDLPEQPSTMQFELRVSGSFEAGKLRAAIADAIAVHPMTRARVVARRFLVRPPVWELADAGEVDKAEVLRSVECQDEREMAAIRDDHYSRPLDLRDAPALVVLLVRRPGGDSLLFKIHHSIMDGIGALRWINSVARAYAGRPDPVPDVDPIAVRDLRAQFGNVDAARPGAGPRTAPGAAVARVAGERASGAPGYAIRHAALSEGQCALLDPCRFGPDATFNDLLIAALHLAIASWNADRGEPCESISILVPANLRPLAWNHEVVANLAIVDRNRTSPEDRSTPELLMAAVTAQTRRMRAGNDFARFLGRPPWQCWLISNVILPLMLYRPWAVPRRIKGAVDTILFANMGRIERRVSGFGEAGELAEFWASPPVTMPMGVGIDAVVLRGRLHLAMRYRRALFAERSAAGFFDSFVATLTRLGQGDP